MARHLPGEPFVIVGKLGDVDWQTSTAILYSADGVPQRVDLSRTLSAKKILQAQKREYRVKGRIIISFVDNSKSTYVEDLEDLELLARAATEFKPLIPSEEQAANNWFGKWADVYLSQSNRSPTWIAFYIWLAIMVCQLIVLIAESWPDAGLVLGAIYVWAVYTFMLGMFCAILSFAGLYFGTEFIYRIKLLRNNRIARAAAFLGVTLPSNLLVAGILYGLVVYDWHCNATTVC